MEVLLELEMLVEELLDIETEVVELLDVEVTEVGDDVMFADVGVLVVD
jgi:hypothetical protein